MSKLFFTYKHNTEIGLSFSTPSLGIIMFRNTIVFVFVMIILTWCYKQVFDYDAYEGIPIAEGKFSITVPSPEALESVLRPFSDAYGFKLQVARTHPTDPHFLIMMWRPDSSILGVNPFGDFNFYIYPAKKNGISLKEANKLVSYLAHKLEQEMPNK
ncbi:hypothetical protein ACJJIW_08225 [Microbulbifer sp. JMSA004]|uniref:hypothetical protein n=1 Tax=Microbulbifer sp. JMSA004 TaxID=3243370 RepID=UPI004039AD96